MSLNVSGHPVDVGGDDFIAYETYRPYPGLGVSGVVADDKGNAVVASGIFSGDKDADGHYILVPATPEQRAAIEAANAAAVPAITDCEIALNAGLMVGGIALPALYGLASPILRGVRAAAISADEALALPKPTGVTATPVMPDGIAAGSAPELSPDAVILRPGGGIRDIDPPSLDSGEKALGQPASDPSTTAPAVMAGGDAPPPPDPPIAASPPEPVGGHIEEKPPQAQETNSPPADGGKGVTKDADSGILEKEKAPNNLVDPTHIAELVANGVKFTPENVIATGRNADGQVIFLETGNSNAGLQHIIDEHGAQFSDAGIPENKIPEVVIQAVTEGKIVGYQGSGTGRPIYQITVGGVPRKIAVTIGDSGYIVGANLRGSN
ncbi:MAG: hypothetical protein WCC64_18765 [Aliidongia sp.]